MRGSITPHKGQPDTWRLQVYLGQDPATGRERRKTKVFHGPRRQAEKALNEMVSSVGQEITTPSSATVEYLLEEWLRFCRGKDLAVRTYDDYQWHAYHRLIPAIGSIPLNALTVKDLDDLYAGLHAQGYSASTIRHAHAVIRLALGQAIRWGWIERNVARLATLPRVAPAPVTAPSVEELQAIMEEMAKSNPQFTAIIGLAALTGARRGELLGLHWNDIDLPHSLLWIRRGLNYTPATGVVVGPTKTKRERRVLLDSVGSSIVLVQQQMLTDACNKLMIKRADNPWLFFGDVDGSKPLHPDSISAAFRRVAKKLDIEGIHFHSLRHFTATQLIAAGVDIRTVSGRLGHANASMTLGIYSHVLEAKDREAGEIMGRLLKP
ncbi:site-specific integrase [Ferrimicrobium sp.]|uniref:tyrosine-type recombinase/integrase n=2 Tax=Ferrimicrobium sp. TaxID=2926050 RepID=UPI002609582D|nr:site-specific integrase [Ferrimicrobium sp.]